MIERERESNPNLGFRREWRDGGRSNGRQSGRGKRGLLKERRAEAITRERERERENGSYAPQTQRQKVRVMFV